jgi:hypothetical protein
MRPIQSAGGYAFVAGVQFVRAVLKLAPNPGGFRVCTKTLGFLRSCSKFRPLFLSIDGCKLGKLPLA